MERKNILFCCDSRDALNFEIPWRKDIERALIALGENVVLADLAKPEGKEIIGRCAEEGLDFILSFQGVGWDIKVNDSAYLADFLNVPFVVMLVDTVPHLTSTGIYLPLRHLLVGCLNQHEVSYLKRLNPSVKLTFFMPLGGSVKDDSMKCKAIADRSYRISLCGNYYPPFLPNWEVSSKIREIMRDSVDLVLANPMLSIEAAVDQAFSVRHMELQDPLYMMFARRYMFQLDRYVRTWGKQRMINAIAEAGIMVDIFGKDLYDGMAGWQNWRYARYARLHGPCTYEESLQIAADSQVVLNMGMFPTGLHDRICTGMLSGAVVVTDPSTYYHDCFVDGEDSLSFDWQRLDELPGRLTALLADGTRMQRMADLGRQKALQKHTWKFHMERLLDVVHTYKAIQGLEA